MITKTQKLYLNKIDNNILIPPDIISECNYVSCVSCCIDYFYQLTVEDKITIVEGEQTAYYLMYNRNYENKNELINDLTTILNQISPNNLSYTCTIDNYTNNLRITVLDSMLKSLQLNSKKLRDLLGLEEINSFSSLLIGFEPIILKPVKQIYLTSDITKNYNQNDISNNILCSYPVEKMGETLTFNVFNNICELGKNNSLNFYFTDSKGKNIKIYGNIHVELLFFKLENLDAIHESQDIQNALSLKLINK